MLRSWRVRSMRAVVCAVLTFVGGRAQADLLLPRGNRLSNGGDDGSFAVTFSPSFAFTFYGVPHTGLGVTFNGVMGWTPGVSDYGGSLANSYAQQAIAPFWADLNSGGGGIYGFQTGSVYAVTFPNAYIYGDDSGNSNSNQFQMALFGAAVQVTRTNTGNVFDFKPGDIAFSYGFMSFTQKTITVGLKDGGRSQAYTGIPGAPDGRVVATNKTLLPVAPETFILFRSDASGSNYTSVVTNFGPPAVTVPTIDSLPAGSVTAGAATLNGDLSSDGLQPTTVTLYWGTGDGGTNTQAWGQTNGFGVTAVGSLTTNLTGLAPNTHYFYRYRAVNASGDDWGSVSISFTTLGAPIVGTTASTAPTMHSVTMDGTLISTGVAPTAVTLFWGPADGGTNVAGWANTVVLGVRPVGPLSTTVDGLSSATRYYYCYYGTNEYGDCWGVPSVAAKTLPDVVTYASAIGTVNIPDSGNGGVNGQAVTSTVTVADDFKIGPEGVIVTFTNLQHGYVSDLIFSLVGPDGTKVDFLRLYPPNRQGGFLRGNWYAFADGYSSVAPAGANWPSGVYMTTNTSGIVSLNASFVGKPAQGTWKLLATDLFGGDTGSFDGWTLGLAKRSGGSVLIVQ